jgi:hypothetical protein
MSAKTIEKEMHDYFMQLNDAEKKSVVQMIKTFLRGRKSEETINIEEYNKEIDDAVARVEAGEFYTQEEVEKMSKEW